VETGVTLRFEELRHPAPVVSLAWSPGSLEIIAPPNDQMISDGLPAVQMASHPALMTVCADRVIRIWVEVVGLVPPGIGGVAAAGELPAPLTQLIYSRSILSGYYYIMYSCHWGVT
jgi:hypothetical protein